jgi:hypothetical protein
MLFRQLSQLPTLVDSSGTEDDILDGLFDASDQSALF